MLKRFQSISWSEISISSIVVAKLWFGVAKSQYKVENQLALQSFLSPISIVDFDSNAAQFCALIRADLEYKGKIIGANDLLIAAHALSPGLILVTNNTREFERVEGLQVENWVLE